MIVDEEKYLRKARVLRNLFFDELFVFLCVLLLIVTHYEKHPDHLFLYVVIMIAVLCLLILVYGLLFCGYPVVAQEDLVCRNFILRFMERSWRFSEIEEVTLMIFEERFAYSFMKLRLKGKKKTRNCRINLIPIEKVPEFVEELRSKGIQVECPPYEYKGETKVVE